VSDNRRLDDELAALTDALLVGGEMRASENLSELVPVIDQLRRVIAPDSRPDPAFQAQLTERLVWEWNRLYQRRATGWLHQRWGRVAALAAGLVLVLLVVVLMRGQGGDGALQGTASGPLLWPLVIVGVGLFGAVLILIWLRRH
jgi:hypothetical protein